jgi:CBS domain containing-hemolysin-like protein
MTPRTVVFSLPDEATVAEAYNDQRIWHFSRIPVHGENNEDLLGVVERRTLARCFNGGKSGVRLSEIMRPIHFVLETQTLNMLLDSLLKAKAHLFAVLDEYGGLAGVVSLEDVLEEILGSEIMDESDRVADMRALARERREALVNSRKAAN